MSILIANYNNAPYLTEAIESVRRQTSKRWEIVIVDDASTDGSWDIIAQMSDDQIRCFRNPANSGVGFTKQRCLAEAKGAYCGILDGDDMLHPAAIETVLRIYDNRPELTLVNTQNWVCDRDLRVVLPPEDADPRADVSSVKGYQYTSHFTTFNRKALIEAGGFNPQLRVAEDLDLMLKLKESGAHLQIQDRLYYYRKHGNSVTNSTSKLARHRAVWHIWRDAHRRRDRVGCPWMKRRGNECRWREVISGEPARTFIARLAAI